MWLLCTVFMGSNQLPLLRWHGRSVYWVCCIQYSCWIEEFSASICWGQCRIIIRFNAKVNVLGWRTLLLILDMQWIMMWLVLTWCLQWKSITRFNLCVSQSMLRFISRFIVRHCSRYFFFFYYYCCDLRIRFSKKKMYTTLLFYLENCSVNRIVIVITKDSCLYLNDFFQSKRESVGERFDS